MILFCIISRLHFITMHTHTQMYESYEGIDLQPSSLPDYFLIFLVQMKPTEKLLSSYFNLRFLSVIINSKGEVSAFADFLTLESLNSLSTHSYILLFKLRDFPSSQ